MASDKVFVQERVIYVAEYIDAVLPGPRDDPLPKRVIFDLAISEMKANGLADHPYFKGSVRRVRSYLDSHWPDIVGAIEEHEGYGIERGHGLPGIRRGGKIGMRKTADWSARQKEREVEYHNRTVDNLREVVELPGIQLKLLLP